MGRLGLDLSSFHFLYLLLSAFQTRAAPFLLDGGKDLIAAWLMSISFRTPKGTSTILETSVLRVTQLLSSLLDWVGMQSQSPIVWYHE